MVQFGELVANISGDIGGIGIARSHFQRQDATSILSADCSSAMTAWGSLWSAMSVYLPSNLTVTFNPDVLIREVDSAALDAIISVGSPPAPAVGTISGDYAAGIGARCDWLTQSLHGRRFLRGCTYFVPLGSSCFTAAGAVSAVTQSAVVSHGNTYIGALNSAALELIVWHRPPKGTITGGAAGLVTAARCPTSPAGLRSRRS